MNTARIVVLTNPVGAGGIAAYLASAAIGLGQTATPENLNAAETHSDAQAPKHGDGVNVVRFGASSPTTTQK